MQSLTGRFLNARCTFGMDVRALAFFRVGLGLILLMDLSLRFRDFEAHYTDRGILPLREVDAYTRFSVLLPLYRVSPHAFWQGAIFLAGFLAAVFFLSGLLTRCSALFCWLILNSIQARNPLVLYGADALLSVLMLWAALLPLGRWMSLDQLLNPSRQKDPVERSVASAALVLQIALLYFVSFLSKYGTTWWNGSAVYYALNLEQYTSQEGLKLLNHPHLLPALTWGTLLIEGLAPLLLFCPVVALRALGIVLLATLQFGFLTFMELGLFPWVSLIALIPLIPTARTVERVNPRDPAWILEGPRLWNLLKPRTASGTWARRFRDTAAAFLLLALVSWHVAFVATRFRRNALKGRLPHPVVTFLEWFRLDQSWTMFSPDPPTDDGWFVLAADLSNGGRVDLLRRDRLVDYAKPELISHRFLDDRWKACFLYVYAGGFSWKSITDWFVDQWHLEHPASETHVVRAQMIFMKEETLPSGTPPPVREVLFSRRYGASEIADP